MNVEGEVDKLFPETADLLSTLRVLSGMSPTVGNLDIGPLLAEAADEIDRLRVARNRRMRERH